MTYLFIGLYLPIGMVFSWVMIAYYDDPLKEEEKEYLYQAAVAQTIAWPLMLILTLIDMATTSAYKAQAKRYKKRELKEAVKEELGL